MAADDWRSLGWARRARSREVDGLVASGGFDPIALLFSLVAAVVLGTSRALRRAPLIDEKRERLLVGGRPVTFGDIDRAMLIVDSGLRRSDLWLRFGTDRALLEAPLRADGKQLDAEARDTLVRILIASSVVILADRYDPKGKFARSAFPTHVTKDEALELVRRPPEPGEPLPIIE